MAEAIFYEVQRVSAHTRSSSTNVYCETTAASSTWISVITVWPFIGLDEQFVGKPQAAGRS